MSFKTWYRTFSLLFIGYGKTNHYNRRYSQRYRKQMVAIALRGGRMAPSSRSRTIPVGLRIAHNGLAQTISMPILLIKVLARLLSRSRVLLVPPFPAFPQVTSGSHSPRRRPDGRCRGWIVCRSVREYRIRRGVWGGRGQRMPRRRRGVRTHDRRTGRP